MKCPGCGSQRLYPSRRRGVFERLRTMLTEKQPYRCNDCNRRLWLDVLVHEDQQDVRPDDLRTGRVPKPVTSADLDQLDTPRPRA